jgi:hypothetical protein
MTLGQPGAVSCLAGTACVDVVMVVPALLSAAGNVDVDRRGPAHRPRSDIVGVSNRRPSLS